MDPAAEATGLFARARAGDARAADALVPLVYGELKRVAARLMAAERGGHTLQPTALVHEAWLKLIDQEGADPADRLDFFRFAARAMREVLVDHARRRKTSKRGGDRARVPLDAAVELLEGRAVDLVALDDALSALAAVDEPLVRIVELRFFAGLTIDDTARALGVSTPTVERGWRTARAFLRDAFGEST